MSERMNTVYRIMYESFTPGMMQRTPFWLKKRMAASLGYNLVRRPISGDHWLSLLLTTPAETLMEMSLGMFDTCAGGYHPSDLLRWSFWKRSLKRIWQAPWTARLARHRRVPPRPTTKELSELTGKDMSFTARRRR
jgi:hypothetical protein